ncbi:MAG: phosphoribosylformylglycinamidine synthase subunit PurQ [Armatimonadota bacterium]|nr:MAG: phosphoribosylformylglycinamidine synthase subunit PurQ [Armatimonadota bacterium]
MKFAVLRFPGSNCDQDAYFAALNVLRQPVEYVWHESTDLAGADCVIIPGGFSYGDYLRCGAVAALSPVMGAVRKFAASGGLVIGICNGFQILCESGLLPGVLLRNRGLRFICRHVYLRLENADTPFTRSGSVGEVLSIPIAHGEGNYFADESTLRELEDSGRVILRYCGPRGEVEDRYNPNGAARNIAGIVNREGNVAGMMPHPERACEPILGSEDGLVILNSILGGRA